jgi:probable phosphoglycerate mutase
VATTVYLIRHGETTWNRELRLQGQFDSPLTSDGIRQAESLARRLAGMGFDAVYSSDLGRARNTAVIITSHNGSASIKYDVRLRERHFGDFQGLTWDEVSERYPDDARRELSGNPMNTVPGGESKHQVLQRTRDFFNDLVQHHPDHNVLVISHGGILNVWTRHVLQLPFDQPRRFHIDNTAINIFVFKGEHWYLKTLGMNV